MTSKNLTSFVNEKYADIQTMAQKIAKGDPLWEDLCGYTLIQFLEHPNADQLVLDGQAMRFMSGIMWRSFNSSTSEFHTIYRQKGRVFSGETPEPERNDYDYETDLVVDQIYRIIELMKKGESDLWYRGKLFEMWLENPNFSDLSRQTGIPRTSISHAVTEAKEYIRTELNKSGITWNS